MRSGSYSVTLLKDLPGFAGMLDSVRRVAQQVLRKLAGVHGGQVEAKCAFAQVIVYSARRQSIVFAFCPEASLERFHYNSTTASWMAFLKLKQRRAGRNRHGEAGTTEESFKQLSEEDQASILQAVSHESAAGVSFQNHLEAGEVCPAILNAYDTKPSK